MSDDGGMNVASAQAAVKRLYAELASDQEAGAVSITAVIRDADGEITEQMLYAVTAENPGQVIRQVMAHHCSDEGECTHEMVDVTPDDAIS